jgi:hypothetical protein
MWKGETADEILSTLSKELETADDTGAPAVKPRRGGFAQRSADAYRIRGEYEQPTASPAA